MSHVYDSYLQTVHSSIEFMARSISFVHKERTSFFLLFFSFSNVGSGWRGGWGLFFGDRDCPNRLKSDRKSRCLIQ